MTDNTASAEPLASAGKPVILLCLSGGGFTSETRNLLTDLRQDFAFTYLKAPWGGDPGEFDVPMGPSHEIPAFANNTRPSTRKSARAFAATGFTPRGSGSRKSRALFRRRMSKAADEQSGL